MNCINTFEAAVRAAIDDTLPTMTEENLLERMEHCVNSSECLKCPNFQPNDLCVDTMLRAAIDIIKDKNSKINDLENRVAINKGAMRAYREAFENAHDEAVTDFSHFLIDKAKDGIIEICDLPDLVAEWRSSERKDAELMKDVNAAFDKAAEGIKPSPTFCESLIAGNSWYDDRFIKVE